MRGHRNHPQGKLLHDVHGCDTGMQALPALAVPGPRTAVSPAVPAPPTSAARVTHQAQSRVTSSWCSGARPVPLGKGSCTDVQLGRLFSYRRAPLRRG